MRIIELSPSEFEILEDSLKSEKIFIDANDAGKGIESLCFFDERRETRFKFIKSSKEE